MRRLTDLPILPALAVLALALLTALPLRAENLTVDLPDGRWYRIDLPQNPKGAPVILGLHGGGGNPNQFARNSGLSEPANARGYAVIYPAGSGRTKLLTWNAGYCCAYAQANHVDDLGFLDSVLADAAQRYGIDVTHVYATGMSNGSMMVERYAAERPGRLKAVAGVSGTMDPSIKVDAPVPLLHIHGTADRMVPFEGGQGGKSITRVPFASVAQDAAAFAAPWPGALTEVQGQTTAPDGTLVVTRDWRRPDGRAAVSIVALQGLDHAWPGGRDGRVPGPDANAMILDFFDSNP